MVGVPVRGPVPEKEGRFPCENHPCGCSTAQHCWDHCCCYSDEEKLRWAAANGVTPPAFLVRRAGVARARLAANAVPERAAPGLSPEHRGCSGCKPDGSRDESRPVIADAQEAKANCERRPSATGGGRARASHQRLIRLESVAKCRGIDATWAKLFGAVLLTDPQPRTESNPPVLAYLRPVDESGASLAIALDPPVPLGFASG